MSRCLKYYTLLLVFSIRQIRKKIPSASSLSCIYRYFSKQKKFAKILLKPWKYYTRKHHENFGLIFGKFRANFWKISPIFESKRKWKILEKFSIKPFPETFFIKFRENSDKNNIN